MPNTSFWPLVAGVGVSMIFTGFLTPFFLGFVPTITVLGIIVLIIGVYGWSYEPAG